MRTVTDATGTAFHDTTRASLAAPRFAVLAAGPPPFTLNPHHLIPEPHI